MVSEFLQLRNILSFDLLYSDPRLATMLMGIIFFSCEEPYFLTPKLYREFWKRKKKMSSKQCLNELRPQEC